VLDQCQLADPPIGLAQAHAVSMPFQFSSLVPK
jgi:hypothetical protein